MRQYLRHHSHLPGRLQGVAIDDATSSYRFHRGPQYACNCVNTCSGGLASLLSNVAVQRRGKQERLSTECMGVQRAATTNLLQES